MEACEDAGGGSCSFDQIFPGGIRADIDTSFDPYLVYAVWKVPVSEPSTALLFTLGLAGLVAKRKTDHIM
jgi:hypothetical protein